MSLGGSCAGRGIGAREKGGGEGGGGLKEKGVGNWKSEGKRDWEINTSKKLS